MQKLPSSKIWRLPAKKAVLPATEPRPRSPVNSATEAAPASKMPEAEHPEPPAPAVEPSHRRHRGRVTLLVWLWCIAAVAISWRLVHIQIVDSERFTARADGQQVRHIDLPARRGRIVDRRNVDLAVSLPAASIGINPHKVHRPRELARRISEIAGLAYEQVLATVSRRTRPFSWVVRNVPSDVAERMHALAPAAMSIMAGTRRAHPLGGLAGQAMGHVNIDEVGAAGLEAFYDEELRGNAGSMLALVNALGDPVPHTAAPVQPPEHGSTLRLTLDADYQAIVEHELTLAVEDCGASDGTAVLYDASTGAIRAVANVPLYDPTDYAVTEPTLRQNRTIADPYEPGSVFKVVAVSAALSEGVLHSDQLIDCLGGVIEVAGQRIHDSHPNDTLTVREVIAQSSNVGTIRISQMLDSPTFYNYIRLFGFGAETGVDLPAAGETKGILAPTSQWTTRSHPTIAIGQEIGVTTLQLAAAYGALANHGWLMKPYLVSEISDRAGNIERLMEPRRVRRVVEPRIADEMTEMLCGVVEEGTGKTARIAGLRVAGKTGTAQIARRDGRGYEEGQYVASFVGFLPEMLPRLICVVSIARPQGSHYGSTVAAPVFKRIMHRIVNRDAAIMQLSADAPSQMMPRLTGMPSFDAMVTLDSLGVQARSVGSGGAVVGQWPPASARIPVDDSVELMLADQDLSARIVPDVRGMTVREALKALASRGIGARLAGGGVVVSQDPSAGSAPPGAEPVILECAEPTRPHWLRNGT